MTVVASLPSDGVSEHRMKQKRKDPVYTIDGPKDGSGMVNNNESGRVWTVNHPSEKNRGSVGYLLLIRREDEEIGPWYVGQVVVREDLRRKGIAETLYARAAAWAKVRGGFQSGWITGEGPAQMWQKWITEGKAVLLPNGRFQRTKAANSQLGPSQTLTDDVQFRVKSDRTGILIKIYAGRTEVGGLIAYWRLFDPKRSNLECRPEAASLLDRFPQIAKRSYPLLIVDRAHVAESHRGQGIGNLLYMAMMAEGFKDGPFLFTSTACSIGSGTSADAKRVWDSLARKFPSEGHVIAVIKRPQQIRTAYSNAKVVEVPNTFHYVVVEPPKAKRKEFPFEGYIDFQGIKIDVENVKGSTRSGKGPDGDWTTFMFAHYGEIRGTEGVDGDKLDVYVGDNHDSSLVVVIHQHNPWDGKYDEDKVILGCESVEEAIGLYKKQYNQPGFFREGEYKAMPIGAFWRWVHEEKNMGKKVKLAGTSIPAAKMATLEVDMKSTMGLLLATLRALGWNHLTSHWQVSGDSFYGDHLLFERIYQTVAGETDTLAEKLVTLFGADAVDAREQSQLMVKLLHRMSDTSCPFERGLHFEHALQAVVRKCITRAEDLSLGLDDFLRTMSNEHETHIYLLQQRLKGVKVASAMRSKFAQAQERIAVRFLLSSGSVTTDEVTQFLKSISTRTGGRIRSVDYYPPGRGGARQPFWSAEPQHRRNPDSFTNTEDGDEGWWEEYAGPLKNEVQKKLDTRFGRGQFLADIGEKGHIDVGYTGLKDLIGDIMIRQAAKTYTLKMEMTLKNGDVIPRGTQAKFRFLDSRDRDSYRKCFVEFPSMRTPTRDYARDPVRVAIQKAVIYLGIKSPSMSSLQKWADDGASKSVTGYRVEMDGYGPDGSPSWLLVFGMV